MNPSDPYTSTQFKPIANSSDRNDYLPEIRVNTEAFEIEQQQRRRAQTQNSPVTSNIQGRKKTYDEEFSSWDNNQEAADKLLQIVGPLSKYATTEEMQLMLAGGWQTYALRGDCVSLDQILALGTRIARWLDTYAQIQAAMGVNQRAARVPYVTNSTPRLNFKREGIQGVADISQHMSSQGSFRNMYQPPAHQRQSTYPSASSVNLSGMASTPERPPRPQSARRGSKAPLSSYKTPPAQPTQSNKRSAPSAPSTPKEQSRIAGRRVDRLIDPLKKD